jgi:CSLREA domain-containing protein
MKKPMIKAGFVGSLLVLICSVSPVAARTPQPGPTFTVNTLADKDDGLCSISDCSLREAINAANAAAGANTVQFAANVTGTITLSLGELVITDAPVTITGPGARVLSVDANLASRILSIAPVSQNTTISISGLTFTRGQVNSPEPGGSASLGGAILNSSKANTTLTSCTISGCFAVAAPGAVGAGGAVNNDGTMTIIGCTFRNNSAVGGSITTRGSTASGGPGAGGGIENGGTVTLQNCTFSNNTAQGGNGGNNTLGGQGGKGGDAYGGALSGNLITITNCTFSGNAAIGGSGGLGNPSGPNGFAYGGAINRNTSTGAPVGNTLIAGNTATTQGPDAWGPFISNGSNLVGKADDTTGFTGSGDKTGTAANPLDPKMMSAPANNGGPTDTIALLAGSPAIDAGNPANSPLRDQRNYIRQNGPDIGAYEFAGIIPVTLANISTRLRVEKGDDALIGGFIVTGTQPKKVIVLAVGPSLPFADKLANPTLELYQGNTLLESNDDWGSSPNKQTIIDSGVAPGNNLESAIVRTLPANSSQYTAIVRGADNSTGIGVVQVYDLDRTIDSKLANIATRGVVQGADDIMIGGFIVSGQDTQKVIIVALGPSLPLAGKLGDPTLQLVTQNGTVLDENDNWPQSADKQAIIDSGVAPTNDLESAIIATLPSNNAQYTAIVRGVGGTTGIAVVEVFALN